MHSWSCSHHVHHVHQASHSINAAVFGTVLILFAEPARLGMTAQHNTIGSLSVVAAILSAAVIAQWRRRAGILGKASCQSRFPIS